MSWHNVKTTPAKHTSSPDYMVYSPMFGGYLFRCWCSENGFGCNEVESMVDDVTHYRLAKNGEVSGQADPKDLPIAYEVEWSVTGDNVWIHASDGSTVGRFGRLGVDLHNTVTEQRNGMPQCRLCTHEPATREHWKLFREKALEWWGVLVPADAFNQQFFKQETGSYQSQGKRKQGDRP